MINKRQYVEYLISTPNNWTCTNLAEHLEGVSHDQISDYLAGAKLKPRQLWELVRNRIQDSADAFLIVDDSVQDKQHSRQMELVKRQWSGNEHRVIKGIGMVNLVHSDGKDGEFYPIDYRVYAPDQDGKTKHQHFMEMFENAITHKHIKARTILFDAWYASVDNLKHIHRCGWTFFTTLKTNRMVSLSKEEGYVHLDQIGWTAERLAHGILVRLKEVPFHVQLFKLVAANGDIDWVITNRLDETVTPQVAQDANDVRWQVEELHRGLKQLAGSEKCQCRLAQSQRNHLACCYHAWLSLKVKALELGKTLYQVRHELFSEYLRAELRLPHVKACRAS